MSPNLLYIIGTLIVTAILLKSVISASAWLAIPSVWYLTNDMDIRIAIILLVCAGVYSQLVILWKSDVEFSKRVPRG